MRAGVGARWVVAVAVAVLVLGVAAGVDGAAPATPRLTVTLVLDTGWEGSPFARSAHDGLARAVRELGVDGRIVVEGPKEPLQPVLLAVARQRPDLVIVTGSLGAPAVDTVATRFPQVRFFVLDAPRELFAHRPGNVQGTIFRVEQPSYLAGYLAGLMEKRRPGRDVVSSVGGYEIPPVDRFIAGYQAGARKSDPGVTMLNGYANSLLNPARCARIALEQIARGSGVVFQVADQCGLGALAAAKKHAVFGIGVDSDQSGLGPHVLTSVVKRLDVAVLQAVRALVDGTFTTGGNSLLTLRNGGVGFGRISPKVPGALVAQVERIRGLLVSGKLPGIPTSLSPR